MTNPYEKLQNELQDTSTIVKEVSEGKRIGYYKLRGVLGKGSFSEVKLGLHILLNEKVAVKVVEKGKHGCQTTLDMMRQEVSVMEKMSHPNIMSLFEVIETLDKFYCVMEYVEGGSLQDYIARKTKNGKSTIAEDSARFFVLQIAEAVQHMHNLGIYHRDLKNENILLASDKTIRIADFGISTCNTEILTDYCGTPPCMPPEIFKRIPYFGAPFDIWTLGVLMYQLVDGHMPFLARNFEALKTMVMNVEYKIPDTFSDELRDLIEKILVENPEDRLTIDDIQLHPWLTGTDNDTTFKEAGKVSDAPVKDKLLELGIPDDAVSEVAVKEYSRVGPRDSIIGTYRIVLHNIQSDNLHSIAYNKGPRFSIQHKPAALLAAIEEVPKAKDQIIAGLGGSETTDSDDDSQGYMETEHEKTKMDAPLKSKKKKPCCSVM